MTLPIISADQRVAEPRCAEIVLVGIFGAGKTSQSSRRYPKTASCL